MKKDRITVISSIFPSYDFAREIINGADGVTAEMLITPGTEPHSYEPSVRDMAKIKESSLFIYLGGESDLWVDELLSTFEGEIKTLKMVDCVPLLEEESVQGMQGEREENEISAQGENDEHVWTSPVNAILISEKICEALCSIDSQNSEIYKRNFYNYKSRLEKLDGEYREFFDREYSFIIADRFPFRYLSSEYAFSYFAAFPGCGGETDPSAATIAFLKNKTEALGTKAVYYTEFSSGKLADTLCEETGVKKYLLHSCHNVSKSEFESGITYIALMEQNLKNLQEAY